jgi:hypothetical protein
VIQQVLGLPTQDLASVHRKGDQAAADWLRLKSARFTSAASASTRVASAGGIGPERPATSPLRSG